MWLPLLKGSGLTRAQRPCATRTRRRPSRSSSPMGATSCRPSRSWGPSGASCAQRRAGRRPRQRTTSPCWDTRDCAWARTLGCDSLLIALPCPPERLTRTAKTILFQLCASLVGDECHLSRTDFFPFTIIRASPISAASRAVCASFCAIQGARQRCISLPPPLSLSNTLRTAL